MKVFELDKEEIISDKKARLDRNNVDYSNVKFLSVDFAEKNWINILKKSNFDNNQKAFFTVLGINYYLTQEQFENLISEVSKLLITGSEIVFDYPTYDESLISKISRMYK